VRVTCWYWLGLTATQCARSLLAIPVASEKDSEVAGLLDSKGVGLHTYHHSRWSDEEY
jgi:hypothetical protein